MGGMPGGRTRGGRSGGADEEAPEAVTFSAGAVEEASEAPGAAEEALGAVVEAPEAVTPLEASAASLAATAACLEAMRAAMPLSSWSAVEIVVFWMFVPGCKCCQAIRTLSQS